MLIYYAIANAAAFTQTGQDRIYPRVLQAIANAAGIVICPSNPITSIGPILAVPGIRQALREAPGKIVAVSPIIARAAISGPAHTLMGTHGFEPSVRGVAKAYADLLDVVIVDREDQSLQSEIEKLGVKPVSANIRMNSLADKRRLARQVLALL